MLPRQLPVVTAPRAGRADRPVGLVVALLLAACSGGAAVPERTVSDRMPQLVEVPLPPGQHSVGGAGSPLAVGADGAVLILPVDVDGPSFHLVGAPDSVVRTYGALGEGPGEMRMPIPLLVNDTSVLGYDLATQRIMIFDRRTTDIVREIRPQMPVQPYMRGPGATLLALHLDRGVEVPALVDPGTGRVRLVVEPSDSYRIEMFADDGRYPGGLANVAAMGRWGDGVVMANGMTYRLGLYDRRGRLQHRIDRNIAPRLLTRREIEEQLTQLATSPMGRTPARLARARQRLEATPTRWFTQLGPPRSDGHDRLWVVVEHGDSTSADVFAGDQLLGRVRLDCPGYSGRWDLLGEWLVLLCVPTDPDAMHDVEVRRWRIVEP